MRKVILKMGLSLMTVLFSSNVQADILTENAGEKAMIQTLRTAINADERLKTYNICLGAGVSGAEAFKDSPPAEQINLYMTWQWLDAMENLADGTVVVMPEHAVNDHFKSIESKVHLIPIQGVLHTRTLENIYQENSAAIKADTKIIVMLGGDTQQQDGQWRPYTKEMVQALIKNLPDEQEILFLNGPRTGKHQVENDKLTEDKEAHRSRTDYITQYVIEAGAQKPWKVIDFKFGMPSLWGPALKFCVEHPQTPLVLPGESTSMISECLSLGIRPIIYKHEAMTPVSHNYVDSLIEKGEATLFPALLHKVETAQKPIEPQEKKIIEALISYINNKVKS